MKKRDYCDGINRRSVLQAGLAGIIGLSVPELLRLKAHSAAREGATPTNDTAVIYLEMAGGPSQHSTYDPKPDAPEEYRGPLGTVQCNVPGIRLSQFMDQQASIMDKLAVIRSIHHDSGSHGTSSHLTQTGYYLQNRQNRTNEMPSSGSITAQLRGPNRPGIPAYVAIPSTTRYGNSAYLGGGFNPYSPGNYSSRSNNFEARNLTLARGLSLDQLEDRRGLLESFDNERQIMDSANVSGAMDQFNEQAFDMVTGDAARDAFDLTREDPRLRQRYDMDSRGMGQACLLARRLVERGVTFITVRMSLKGSWDDHRGIYDRMEAKGPFFDRAVATLVQDLHDRGLARKVMVVAMGEFGRTPRVNGNAGRDHWGRVMSVLMAGGDLRTGQVVGSSDSNGAVPHSAPYRPENVLAMMYRHLGIDSAMTIPDPTGRPRYILEERGLIEELL